MKAWLVALLIAAAGFSGNAYGDHLHADNPVDLVEAVAGFIFADVAENLETYTENPEGLQTLVRTELMPVLDVHYAARLVLGRAGRGVSAKSARRTTSGWARVSRTAADWPWPRTASIFCSTSVR